MENSVSVDLKKGIKTFKSKIPKKDLSMAWASGNYANLYKVIPFNLLFDDLLESMNGIKKTVHSTGEKIIPKLPVPIRENLRWDTKNPSILNFINTRSKNLVDNISQDTQSLIAKTIAKSFDKALTPDRAASEIRDSIGLNNVQSRALENYRSGLESQNMKISQVDKLTSEYEERLLDQRAIMIARTEINKAMNFGQLSVWKAAKDQGLIDGGSAKKSWQVDGRPCDDCIDLGDQDPIGIDEMWESVDGPIEAPPLHPNCFLEGHRVLTKNGMVRIEEIKVGDLVLTHKLRWKKVIKTFCNDYQGEIACLEINGIRIESTLDHPFLIGKRWIYAGDLTKGDQAFKVSTSNVMLKKINNKPSMFGKILELFSVGFRFLFGGMPIASINLNSNSFIRNSDIDVVFPKRQQWRNFDTSFFQFTNKIFFEFGKLHSFMNSNSSSFKTCESSFGASKSLVSCLSNLSSSFGSSPRKSFNLSFGQSSNRNSSFFKPAFDCATRTIKSVRHFQYGKAFIKHFYNFINIQVQSIHSVHPIAIERTSKRFFYGKVFNITVEDDHSFVCEGIIVHNCMCSMELEFGDSRQKIEENNNEEEDNE